MPTLILAHDLGTTGDKATLFSAEGSLLCSAFEPYETFYPRAGWAEQDPAEYWRAFCASTSALLQTARIALGDIAVVAFSGQMMAALPVDGQGAHLHNSIIWADLRATREVEELAGRIGAERVYRLTGHRLSASYSAGKIMWLRRNFPDVYGATNKFIHAKDYVVGRLTGRLCTDYSDASGMNLLDIERLVWSEELLEATGIQADKLPDLVESTEVVGTVSGSAAVASGLKAGTPVVIGGGDGPCATAGAGVVRRGESYIYVGSSTWMGLATDRPLIDPGKRTATFAHFRKGLYMPAGTMQAGGGSFKWCKDVLGDLESEAADRTGLDPYDLLSLAAEQVPAGAEGLLFLPYLLGERSPLWDPNARGCFIGLSMLHGKKHMVRAVLEGVALNMRHIREAFAEQGVTAETVRMIGGGARSRLWRSIFADILERPIQRLNFIEEATSVGAAIAGGVGVGLIPSLEDAGRFVRVVEEIPPNPAHFDMYRRRFEVFRSSYESLRQVFEALAGDRAP
jgi:xylulokinase